MAYRKSTDKNSSDYNVVIVVKGDCLWSIAEEFLGDGSLYPSIKKLNNLTSNVIQPKQELKIAGSSSGSTSSSSSSNSDMVEITQFGLMASASSNNTLFAVWTWGKTGETEHYEYQWEYTIADTGDTWWTGQKSTTEDMESSYNVPDNAERVRFRVKPISKTYTKKSGKTTTQETHWTAKWCGYQYYSASDLPPETPGTPSVRIDETNPLKLIAEIDGINADALNATHVEFQVVRNNTSTFASQKCKINTGYSYVSHEFKSLPTGSEFKVRCRSCRGSLTSDWSGYSSAVSTPPPKPAGFTVCKAKSQSTDGNISVYLEWKAVDGATAYDIEYAEKVEYFDTTDQVQSLVTNHTKTQYESFSLYDGSNGGKYYLRLRATNGDLKSDWSEPSEVTLGEKPSAPTTWSSTTVASVGGPLNLYWVHNSTDGSSETYAQLLLEIYIANGLDESGNTNYELKWSTETEIKKSTDVDEADQTSVFDVATYLANAIPAYYKDGVQLRWRVRTSGVTNELGDWSVMRTVEIHAQPSVALEVSDPSNTINSTFDTLGSFPIHISATTSPATQAPIGFYVTIVSNAVYETVDNVGNNKTVNAGEEVYSKYFDRNTDLDDLVLSAGDVDLETGVNYTLTCVAAMNSGLTAEASLSFTVSWVDVSYTPNAVIEYDYSRYITRLRPYCNLRENTFYNVTYDSATDTYTATSTEINPAPLVPVKKQYMASGKEVFTEYLAEDDTYRYYYVTSSGVEVEVSKSAIVRSENVLTTTGEQVYSGLTDVTIDTNGNVTGGEDMFFYVKTIETPVEGVRLAVYRREFDGSFTELATNIDNLKNTYITDPHPALDYARYRIVATTESTGAVSYYDMPAYPIQEKAVIIQWDEEWSNFDVAGDDPRSQPPWSGSLLRLPYNIDVTDSYNMDVSHVEYVGRKRPVSYYGTQLGETSTWNVDIAKDDEETLYALRRLAIWTGDAYVREPSGTGYWATVTPGFSQKHTGVTIPVTLTIKRVEGGA